MTQKRKTTLKIVEGKICSPKQYTDFFLTKTTWVQKLIIVFNYYMYLCIRKMGTTIGLI